ncbi:MAG TPA: hypothetical protein VD837_07140, partial [Terriglobales bacterium]|nr:hypothetical protein [Terriglobales bacterium]
LGRSIGLYTPPAARIGVVQRTSLSTLKSCKNTEPTPKKGGFVSSLRALEERPCHLLTDV